MGCCSCYEQIEREKKKEAALCIELKEPDPISSSKHLSVIQKLNKDYCNNEKYIESKENTMNDYKLNDLRSLEGVAILWSKKLQTDSKLSFLQKSKSTPITGNMYNVINELSPISISTYFFQHTPANQLNLLRSHSDHMSTMSTEEHKKPNQYHTLSETPDINTTQNVINFNNKYKHVTNFNNINLPNINIPNMNMNMNNNPDFVSQKFSSLSASNLQSPYLQNLSPLVSDNDEENQEMEIEIEIDIEIENEEDNIFAVIENMEPMFNLTNEDFMEHSSGKFKNIGVGASGIVTKAFHFASCKMLAIKHCRSTKKNKLLAFQKETELYKQFLQNKYIIDIIGMGKGEKNNELIMGLEFMDLNSCKSLQIDKNIQNIQHRELIVGHIACNVLIALCDLHENLYVHNDVKPANILVNKYGEIKLSDFDTVLQMKNKTDFLRRNNGTQKYQSPEKLIFVPCYTTNSDIWSLGITLYELLFGDKTCESGHDEVSYTTNPPVLDPNTHGLSVHCCDFMNQCLIVKRDERPEAADLLKHVWIEEIKLVALKDKWPWLVGVMENKSNEFNMDLLFMINSLIIHYSSRKFDSGMSKSTSYPTFDQGNSLNVSYSDEQRIENMAKYAYCTKDTVLDRIRVTVSYIKSQLNTMDMQ